MVELAESVLESMQDAVLVISPRGTLLHANRAAYRLLGYDHRIADLIGRPVRDIIPADQDPMQTSQLQRALVGVELREEWVTMRARSGESISTAIAGDALLGPDDDLVGVVLVARDQRLAGEPVAGAAIELERRAKLAADLLGTKRELEANLNKVRNQLVHAERLATVGNIAGGVGHELEVISLVLELELEALATIRGVRESTAFTELSRAISVIKTHAGGLLAMARPGPDFTAPEDLCEVFRSVIRTLRISGKLTDVAVTTDFEEEPVMVSVNRTRIEQILINLMLNAIDSFEPPSQSPTIHLSIALIPHSQRIACRVEDNGCGIVSDDIDRIFDSYFSTKFESGHMGMGLVVARQIVESYGGTLMVSSRADSGTSFSFDLLRAVQDDEPLD